jgi:hypothetical protein
LNRDGRPVAVEHFRRHRLSVGAGVHRRQLVGAVVASVLFSWLLKERETQ